MEAAIETAPRSFHWYEVWWKIYFHPTVSSFQGILADPNAKPGRAIIWVAITGLILSITKWTIQGQINYMFWVFEAIFATAGLIIVTYVIHVISKLFGGQSTYYQLMYCIGAILAPYYTVLRVLQLTDRLTGYPANYLYFILAAVNLAWWVLGFILIVNAVRAAEKISLGKGILSATCFVLLVIMLFISPLGNTMITSFWIKY
jgi:hypothetical protein